MEYSARRIIIIRVWEFLKLSFLMSALCTLLNEAGFNDKSISASIFFLGTLGYFIFNMIDAKRCYIALARKTKPYLIRNIIAYMIYVVISLSTLQFFPDVAKWLFSIMIVLDFCIGYENLPAVLLALPFHAIGLLIITLLPVYMKYGRGILRIEKITRK